MQEREQWHSGANFFALGEGKVIGYGRTTPTSFEDLNWQLYNTGPSRLRRGAFVSSFDFRVVPEDRRDDLDLSRRAAAAGEVPVGALLVENEVCVAEGWNQPISSNDATAHAERFRQSPRARVTRARRASRQVTRPRAGSPR